MVLQIALNTLVSYSVSGSYFNPWHIKENSPFFSKWRNKLNFGKLSSIQCWELLNWNPTIFKSVKISARNNKPYFYKAVLLSFWNLPIKLKTCIINFKINVIKHRMLYSIQRYLIHQCMYEVSIFCKETFTEELSELVDYFSFQEVAQDAL